MKIALAHDFLNQFGGAERVLKIFTEIYPKAPIFTLFYDEEFVSKNFPSKKIIPSYLQRWPFFKKGHKYFLPFLPKATESLDFSSFEVILSNTTAWMKGIKKPKGAIHICYCNSPTRFLWDWRKNYLDEQRIFGLKRVVVEKILDRLCKWDLEAALRVDFWLTISKNSQKRFKKYYHKKPQIIYPPIDTLKFKISPYHDNYFLVVSRLSGYKRIDLAIRAFNKLGFPLIIIGDGSEREYLAKIAKKNIKFLGFQNDKITKEYYSRCRAFIFPTFDEDFGLTPLEAMASGRPVIAAGRGGSRESIVEGTTGEFFNEENEDSLIEGIKRFIKNEKKYHPEEIKKQALAFDKEVFKKKIKKFVAEKYQSSFRK